MCSGCCNNWVTWQHAQCNNGNKKCIIDLCVHVTRKFLLKSTPSIWLHQRSSELRADCFETG